MCVGEGKLHFSKKKLYDQRNQFIIVKLLQFNAQLFHIFLAYGAN